MSIRCEKCGCELTIEQVDFIGNVKNGPDGKMHTDRKCIEHLRTQLAAAIARAEKAEASLLDANEWISVYKEWADVAARTLAKFEGTSRRGAHG